MIYPQDLVPSAPSIYYQHKVVSSKCFLSYKILRADKGLFVVTDSWYKSTSEIIAHQIGEQK